MTHPELTDLIKCIKQRNIREIDEQKEKCVPDGTSLAFLIEKFRSDICSNTLDKLSKVPIYSFFRVKEDENCDNLSYLSTNIMNIPSNHNYIEQHGCIIANIEFRFDRDSKLYMCYSDVYSRSHTECSLCRNRITGNPFEHLKTTYHKVMLSRHLKNK